MTTSHKFNLNAFLGRQFDWHGEASRMQFFLTWLASIGLTLVVFIPVYIMAWTFFSDTLDYGLEAAAILQDGYMSPAVYVCFFIWNWVAGILLSAMLLVMTMTTVKRLAHMGWSRWAVLLATVPVINFVFLLILFFWPGKKVNEQAA